MDADSGARDNHPRLVGGHDELSAIAQPELGQDAADMRFRRRMADDEPLGEFGVRQPGRDELEYLDLALGQRREQLATRPTWGSSGELAHQPRRDPRGEQ